MCVVAKPVATVQTFFYLIMNVTESLLIILAELGSFFFGGSEEKDKAKTDESTDEVIISFYYTKGFCWGQDPL